MSEVPMSTDQQQLQSLLVEYFVIADIPRPPESVLDPKVGVTWYNMSGCNLGELQTRILLILESKTPVFVVSLAHQALLHEDIGNDVYESIKIAPIEDNRRLCFGPLYNVVLVLDGPAEKNVSCLDF